MQLASRLNQKELRLEPGQRVLKARDYQHFVEAQGILGEAHEIARDIELAAKDAYLRCEKDGYAEGMSRAAGDVAQRQLESIDRAIRWMREMEDDLTASVLQALEKLVGSLDIDDLTLRLIKKALQEYRNLPDIRLHVAPSQVEAVEEALAGLYREIKPAQFLRIEADSRMQPGDCMLKSPLGTVDIGLSQQLEALRRQLGASEAEVAA